MAPAVSRVGTSRVAAAPMMSAVDEVMDKLKSMTLLEAAELGPAPLSEAAQDHVMCGLQGLPRLRGWGWGRHTD